MSMLVMKLILFYTLPVRAIDRIQRSRSRGFCARVQQSAAFFLLQFKGYGLQVGLVL